MHHRALGIGKNSSMKTEDGTTTRDAFFGIQSIASILHRKLSARTFNTCRSYWEGRGRRLVRKYEFPLVSIFWHTRCTYSRRHGEREQHLLLNVMRFALRLLAACCVVSTQHNLPTIPSSSLNNNKRIRKLSNYCFIHESALVVCLNG